MVASGATVTALEMYVVTVGLAVEEGIEESSADVGVDMESVSSGVEDPPITHFSLMIHPSPMWIGPSYEYSRARGWITVPVPMLMGCVPCKTAESATVAVLETCSGGRECAEDVVLVGVADADDDAVEAR